MSISVIILTYNEEKDIAECIHSVSWTDDVHVFDSGSTDRTLEIAISLGACVTHRKFDGYASHRNAALEMPGLKYGWILFLDADERIPNPLAEECRGAVGKAADDVGAFRLRRRDFLMGAWLRHAQLSPYYVRLQRRGRTHYQREVNEVVMVDGRIEDLKHPFDHYPFSKGITHWVEKHNRYSTMEAALILSARRDQSAFSFRSAFFDRDFNQRRLHQKALFYRMPFRPLVKLIYMLFIRRAILDGRAGVIYSFLQCFYEWLIVLKTEEQEMGEGNSKGSVQGTLVAVGKGSQCQ